MREINLASVITTKRRERGVTQEELAAHVGVSKASVSKWETGQSYPDIVLLPQLAAYFDISIDQLVGYASQMSEGDVKRLYRRLASDFAEKPFEDVVAECKKTIKNYYSCYPLLLQMAMLYVNHASLAPDGEWGREMLTQAVRLCERVRENSKDTHQLQSAAIYQAISHLSLGDGEAVLGLLGESPPPNVQEGALIAQAHQALGRVEESQEILQIELFQNLMATFQSLMIILQNNLTHMEVAETVYRRAEGLANLFQINRLNPNCAATLYAMGAQMYQMGGFPDQAMELLSKYADVCTRGFFPVTMQGDEFFDKIGRWLAEHVDVIPRSDAVIKESMLQDVLWSPVFEPLRERPEFKQLVRKLRNLKVE